MPFVNEDEVPGHIPANAVLTYFPRGIVGLREAVTNVPVFLDDNGDLVFPDENGQYVLKSLQNHNIDIMSAASPQKLLEKVEASATVRAMRERSQSMQLMGRAESPVIARGGSTILDDFQNLLGIGSRPPSPKPRDDDLGSLAGGEGVTPHGSFSARSINADMVADNSASFYGGEDQGAADAGSSGSGILLGRGRRMMIMRFLIGIVTSIVLQIGSQLFEWVDCNCVDSGMWTVCRKVPCDGLNLTSRLSNTSFGDRCMEPRNSINCSGPKLVTIRAMTVIALVSTAVLAIIFTFDLWLQWTPRRPFYAVFFVMLISFHSVPWAMYAHGMTTYAALAADRRPMTLIECDLASQIQTLFLLGHRDDTFTVTCDYSVGFIVYIVSFAILFIAGIHYFYSRYRAWTEFQKRSRTNRAKKKYKSGNSTPPPPPPGTAGGRRSPTEMISDALEQSMRK